MNDTVKVDLKTNKIIGHIKFEVGNLCFITKGHNIGRVGVVVRRDRHFGSFDIVHVRDAAGHEFVFPMSSLLVKVLNLWLLFLRVMVLSLASLKRKSKENLRLKKVE